jgi:serine/threonine protein kinase
MAQREQCGPYVLQERLGMSALSEVWRATASGQGVEREVAVRRLRALAAKDALLVASFNAAARRASRLSHGRLVALLDVGADDGRPYCVMEHVRGYTLTRVLLGSLQGKQPMPPGLAVFVGMEILKGLAYAHAHREGGQVAPFIHGRLGPPNIFITPAGELKIADLGIARALAGNAGVIAVSSGASYLAPEQLAGATPDDPRVDLFAVGTMIYELLAGRPAFPPGATRGALKPLAQVAAGLPPRLGAVVEQLLQTELESRPATALDAIGVLRPFADGDELRLAEFLSRFRSVAFDVGKASGEPTPPPAKPKRGSVGQDQPTVVDLQLSEQLLGRERANIARERGLRDDSGDAVEGQSSGEATVFVENGYGPMEQSLGDSRPTPPPAAERTRPHDPNASASNLQASKKPYLGEVSAMSSAPKVPVSKEASRAQKVVAAVEANPAFARPASAGPTAEGTFALVVDVDTGGYDSSEGLPAVQVPDKAAAGKPAAKAKADAPKAKAAAGGDEAPADAAAPAKKAVDPEAKKAAIEAAKAKAAAKVAEKAAAGDKAAATEGKAAAKAGGDEKAAAGGGDAEPKAKKAPLDPDAKKAAIEAARAKAAAKAGAKAGGGAEDGDAKPAKAGDAKVDKADRADAKKDEKADGKKAEKDKKEEKKATRSELPTPMYSKGWIWMILLLTIALVAAFFYYGS